MHIEFLTARASHHPSPTPPEHLTVQPPTIHPRPPGTPDASMSTQPSLQLERFANPEPKHEYLIHLEVPEFSCLCPLTGQPDFAVLTLDYLPHHWCIELKSLKLYMWSFRDQGAFHEAVSNQIARTIANRLEPRFLRLISRWFVRGGIYTTVQVEHRKRGWKPPIPVDLGSLQSQATLPYSR